MTGSDTVGSGLTARQRRRLWVAWVCAGLAFYPLPLIRTGVADYLINRSYDPPLSESIIRVLLEFVFPAVLACLPLGAFWLWSLPHAEREALPRRSLILLILLIAYLPFQLVFEPHWLGERARNTIDLIDSQVPAISFLRHIDKPLLVLLGLWSIWRARHMAPFAQLIFHGLLAVCFVWALAAPAEIGFGSIFVTLPEP